MSQVDRPFSLPGDTSGHWFKSPDILSTSVAVVHVKSVEGKKLLKTTNSNDQSLDFNLETCVLSDFRAMCKKSEVSENTWPVCPCRHFLHLSQHCADILDNCYFILLKKKPT